jgi:hypothetical protein
MLFGDGELERIRWGDEQTDWDHGPRCGDCAVLPGGVHHFGCDIEECPRCHGQLITCECPPPTDAEEPVPFRSADD